MDRFAPPTPLPPIPPRPRLSAANVEKYLDWVATLIGRLSPADVDQHLKAAELVIRTRATDAQAKATQHTLVQDGVIDPPPAAS